MLEPRGIPEGPEEAAQETVIEAECTVPLAVRAKRAAWRAVASCEPLPPPPEDLKLSFDLDSLYAGGENLWVSAEVGVAKEDGEEEDEEGGIAGVDAEGAEHRVLSAQRAPADLLVVVDVSGSMSSALPSVRKCLASLASLVEAQDRLALVKFDNQAECVLPWTVMDEEGIRAFRAAQRDLVARGGTSFLPVLKMCLSDLLEDEVAGRTRSMLFISDGMPDESDADILRLVCEECTAPNLTIVTAGFGAGVKADLMGSLAQAGSGPFVYIQNEQSIPVQLGRIWAAVAYTSICAGFLVLRPLAGAQVTAVEGAFGTAELCLRPDGQKSEQQVLLVQLGPVRHGTSRETAFRLKLPPALQRRPLQDAQLRAPLLEVSLLVEPVVLAGDAGAPVFLQKLDFLPLQVPSLLAEKLLPFPVRFVLENDLDEGFDAAACLRQVAQTLGIEESELQLNSILSGSIIVDFSLKLKPECAAEVLKNMRSSKFQAKMGEEFGKLGYQMKSVKASGQQVFRRLLQTRFAGALGTAAETISRDSKADDVPELRAVKQLACSDLADSLDPPGKGSMAAAVAQDCKTVLHSVAETACGDGRDERRHIHHNMLQLRAAHVAQYKCQTVSASLEAYEVKEAKVAVEQMESACAGVSVTTAFLDSTSESVEMRTHPGVDGHVGVLLLLTPRHGAEEDFGYLAKELCPTFQVKLTAEDGATEPRVACAYPVHAHNMLPICVRSGHPATLFDHGGGKVAVPFARRLKISVDKRSCVGSSLKFFLDCTSQKPFKVVHRTSVRALHEKPETFYVKGADFWYIYEHPQGDSQVAENWGFEFEVQVAEDKDGQVMESRPRGMLLQARFAGVTTGNYKLSATLSPEVLEVQPSAVSTCELADGYDGLAPLVACANQCLQLDATMAQLRGLRSPARLVGVNGSLAQSIGHLRDLVQAVPATHTVQATILTSPELDDKPIDKLQKEDLTKVPENRQQAFAGTMIASL